MDWSQHAYLAILAAAIIAGRDQRLICIVMACNLAATLTGAADLMAVGTADVLSAFVLIGHGARANVIAALFVAMVPVYIAGAALAWKSSTVYAIIDALAYLQCGVLGRVDRGGTRLARRIIAGAGAVRHVVRRGTGMGHSVPARRHAPKSDF